MTDINITKTNVAIINKMVKSGKSFTAIKGAMLALDMVDSAESADAYLNSLDIKKGRRGGFTHDMHQFLIDAPRTQADFFNWIKENGSDKVWKYRKNYESIRQLSVALYEKLAGIKFEEVLYVELVDFETEAETPEDSEVA